MGEPSIEILFEVERNTTRTRKFGETAVKVNGVDNPGPAMGTIYIQQWALKEAFGGNLPDNIVVTITAAVDDEGS